jgi:hypothetical protein
VVTCERANMVTCKHAQVVDADGDIGHRNYSLGEVFVAYSPASAKTARRV